MMFETEGVENPYKQLGKLWERAEISILTGKVLRNMSIFEAIIARISVKAKLRD